MSSSRSSSKSSSSRSSSVRRNAQHKFDMRKLVLTKMEKSSSDTKYGLNRLTHIH